MRKAKAAFSDIPLLQLPHIQGQGAIGSAPNVDTMRYNRTGFFL
jgi:hypothetical protein